LTVKPKLETANSRPQEEKKSDEKSMTKKELAVVTEKKKMEKTNPVIKEIAKSEGKNVKLETLNLEQNSSSGNIFIIVGSFKIESNASKLTSNLIAKGYIATTIKNKNGMTYAAVGGFKNEETANDTLQKLKSKEGMDAWIYKM
jgi:cell division septation protein DedD